MILLVLFFLILGGAITFALHVRNKQADRSRHNRERLEEKQGELLGLLRKGKNNEANPENGQQ